MATEIERLIVRLEVSQAKFEKQMAAASRSADKSARRIESRFSRMNKSVSGSFRALQGVMYKAFAAAAALRGAQVLIDSSIRIENALKVTGLAGTELTKVYDRLFDSAQKNAVPLEAMVTLYSRASMAAQNLGASQEDLLKFTDTVAVSLRVGGKSAQEASGALLQLSQLLGGATVQAQEYNSLIDGAYPLLQAVASGLREAGGDVSKLTQLVKDGKVPVKAFFDAAQAGSSVLEEKVADSAYTVSQQFGRLQTSLIKAAGKFNKSSEAAATLGAWIEKLTKNIDNFDLGGMIAGINEYITAADNAAISTQNWIRSFGQATGLDNIGEAIANNKYANALGFYSEKALDRRMGDNAATSSNPALADALAAKFGGRATAAKTGRVKPDAGITPITLEDYKPPAKTGGGRNASGGGSSSESDYAREVAQVRERTKALEAQTKAMAGINPLIDDYGFALEKARTVSDLLLAAEKAKIKITPALSAAIGELATQYAEASAAEQKLAESQDRLRQSAEDMKALGKDVMGGFISDLRAGKSASEALAGALQKVQDKLLDMAFNSLFDSGGGGILGGAPSEPNFTGARK